VNTLNSHNVENNFNFSVSIGLLFESKSRLEILSVLNNLKDFETSKLSEANFKGMTLKTNVMIKFLVGSSINITLLIVYIPFIYWLITCYFEDKYEYSIFNIVFFNFLLIIWLFHNIKTAFANIFYIYLATTYLKYRFEQICSCMRKPAKFGNNFKFFHIDLFKI